MLHLLRQDVEKISDPDRAHILSRFFKTGKGEYGEGDVFLGITVPQSRTIAKKYRELQFDDIKKLLQSKHHEERLIGLLILVDNFQKGHEVKKKQIFSFYLQATGFINNWDLVDLSADKIVGAYLHYVGNRHVCFLQLSILAKSENIWERRIAIVATYHFIKNSQFEETLQIATILLSDKHDLIQKAVGWMLREVGKRDKKIEEQFLKKYYKVMPRTMLRYAIEKFTEAERQYYLKK